MIKALSYKNQHIPMSVILHYYKFITPKSSYTILICHFPGNVLCSCVFFLSVSCCAWDSSSFVLSVFARNEMWRTILQAWFANMHCNLQSASDKYASNDKVITLPTEKSYKHDLRTCIATYNLPLINMLVMTKW